MMQHVTEHIDMTMAKEDITTMALDIPLELMILRLWNMDLTSLMGFCVVF